ncbi:hypothetical protein [Halobacillus hunanensis]|uniref:hypothetical protein n=1 Tax=Halobacillus hunanensis TaxID=578214 RepID=UPI0009A8E155|nr:hypothetical protein [Halobacillus hunanensis]
MKEYIFLLTLSFPGEDGQTVIAHIRGEKYQDLMLVTDQSDTKTNGKGVVINLTVKDINSFSDKALKFDGEIIEGPIDRPWNA